MHKITDRSSAQTALSIPVMAESCSAAVDWYRASTAVKDPQPPETAQLDPLYLFGCSLLWHKQEDAAAAWELIHGLQSANQGTRVVVSALLAKRRTPREIGAAQVRRIPLSPRCRP